MHRFTLFRQPVEKWKALSSLLLLLVIAVARHVHAQPGSVDCAQCDRQASGCVNACTNGSFRYLCGQDAEGNNLWCDAASNKWVEEDIYKCDDETSSSGRDCIGGNEQTCATALYYEGPDCTTLVGTASVDIWGCSTSQPGCES